MPKKLKFRFKYKGFDVSCSGSMFDDGNSAFFNAASIAIFSPDGMQFDEYDMDEEFHDEVQRQAVMARA